MEVLHSRSRQGKGACDSLDEARFRARVVRMGVVPPHASTAAAMEALRRQGICSNAAQQWLSQEPSDESTRQHLLAEIYDRLEDCPSPATEWQAVRDVLNDDELLAALLGLSAVSIRRYCKGERQCSDAVAARLHWLALVIDQLEGTYNAHGIRRWFQRPRSSLDGQAPSDRLKGDWDPDDAAIRAIASLAHSACIGMMAS